MRMSDNKPTGWELQFIEDGAVLEHQRWARWQQYLFSRCIENSDGSMTIPSEEVVRWKRQIATPYNELTEVEKDSDRSETRNYVPLIRSIIAQLRSGRKF